MVALPANMGWFNLKIEGGPDFEVYRLKGSEKLNEPYEFELELVSRQAGIDLISLLGRQALLNIADHDGGWRKVHGTIRQSEQLHTANAFTHYRILIVPRLWYLSQNQNHRIFQHKSVVQIINDILKEQKFLTEHVVWQLREKYQAREYCVQYGESDLYFINRLCEEEGIYFYFEHQDNAHILCFSDASGGPWIPQSSEGYLRFYPGSGQVSEASVIVDINYTYEVNSDTASYREWNFEKPSLDLAASVAEQDRQKAPAPGGLNLDTYQFPHLYNLNQHGDRYVQIQLLRQLSFVKWVTGSGNVARLTPGFAFQLQKHPRHDLNAKWWLTAVDHYGEQPQVLEHEAPDRGFVYQSRFMAIPFETRFVPDIKHPKKLVEGLQSAIVTGPCGEEVYVDEYGRVKVHFHWDRLGPMSERSTCWVRVADAWSGMDFGFIETPRVGQEVYVEFMEGDPDRPVVTGRAYNAEKMPPWHLPGQKTLSGIQSREFKSTKRNQIVFDDTQGQVQTQLSSDHQLSQLNLGYLTRITHGEGRKDFRGEGFELRTDGWGAIRAGKGLLISTDARQNADSYHKDLTEALDQIFKASKKHKGLANLATQHEAQPEEYAETSQSLDQQVKQIKGAGEQGELSAPQMVLSGPAGLALATPQTSHVAATKNIAMTAGENMALAAGGSLVSAAMRRVSFFARKGGMKLFAGQKKMEVQAQSNDLDVIAAQVMKIISAKKMVHISAPKEIILSAGGSYLKINEDGIESGTRGQFIAYASSHILSGPKSKPYLELDLPKMPFDEQFVLQDEKGRPLAGILYKITAQDGQIYKGVTDEKGRTERIYSCEAQEIKLELV